MTGKRIALIVGLVFGILLIAMGIGTLVRPSLMFTLYVYIWAVFAIFTGVMDILLYVNFLRYSGFAPFLSLLTGIISIMVGAMLFLHPGVGMGVLSILLPIWFIAHSINRLVRCSDVRRYGGTWLYVVSLIIGIAGLIIGILLLFLPAISLAVAAVIISIYFILLGIETICTALSHIGDRF